MVLTSDNPRSEDPLAILAAIRRGADEALAAGAAARLEVEPDRRAAMRLAVSLAGPGDVLVVAGKGHESGQEVDGVVHPFDDRRVLRRRPGGGRPVIAADPGRDRADRRRHGRGVAPATCW